MLGRAAADPGRAGPRRRRARPNFPAEGAARPTRRNAAAGPLAAVVAQRRRLLAGQYAAATGQEPGKVAQRFKLGFCAPRRRRTAFW